MGNNLAIEMKNITKTFGAIVANKNVTMDVVHGEILAVLGENGSGKTTLMNMLAGIYYPDEGEIFINGAPAVIRSPKDAFGYGIGMIHQHFKLIDVFTATENIVLGLENEKKYDLKAAKKKVVDLCTRYGFEINPDKKIYEMSVSEKQTVEIIKVLYRGAEILILDEPTAVLTPQETKKLFAVLKKMKEDGKSVLIITHKLNEVMDVSDRVAILRKGEHIKTVVTGETTISELTETMVGKAVTLNIQRDDPTSDITRLSVKNISAVNKDGVTVLDNISFDVKGGEIFGIAGIAGSGQRELLEAIAGLQPTKTGDIYYYDPKTGNEIDLKGKTPLEIINLGVRLSFVPEDRLGMGLVPNMDIIDNMMLRSYNKTHSLFINRSVPSHLADDVVHNLEVVTPNTATPVRKLSGGNVQKVLVGREIASHPKVLMVAYPVRGLDINSSYLIYNLLNDQKKKGTAIIFVGEDLDVLMALCDRIMVLCGGRVSGTVDGRTAVKEEIGYLMTKAEDENA